MSAVLLSAARPSAGGPEARLQLEADVLARVGAADGVAELGDLHRGLWADGWTGLGNSRDLAETLRDLGFQVETIDGRLWVSS